MTTGNPEYIPWSVAKSPMDAGDPEPPPRTEADWVPLLDESDRQRLREVSALSSWMRDHPNDPPPRSMLARVYGRQPDTTAAGAPGSSWLADMRAELGLSAPPPITDEQRREYREWMDQTERDLAAWKTRHAGRAA